jgi:arylformamidase
MRRIIDISQPIREGIAVWPGDQPHNLSWTMRQDRGDSVNVAAMTMSVHTGTHADGPFHVAAEGARAGAAPLANYFGTAVVVDVRPDSVIGLSAVAGLDLARAERVLFRTRDAVDPSVFPQQFAHIDPALARRLGEAGILLVGTDAPSVDPFDSKTLETHHILGAHGVAILENLVLTDVAPGRYTLIALPLRLEEADSSPVRAVLVEW